ncbi:hypothetical protein BCR44DRAFT_1440190, partial [Catenaria anguillulae PL171]
MTWANALVNVPPVSELAATSPAAVAPIHTTSVPIPSAGNDGSEFNLSWWATRSVANALALDVSSTNVTVTPSPAASLITSATSLPVIPTPSPAHTTFSPVAGSTPPCPAIASM